MASKTSISNQDSFAATCSSIVSGVISFFLLILVTIFPLVYDNSYFNILETKYKWFYMSVLGMLVVLLVLSIVMLIIDLNEFKGEHAARLFSALLPRNWKTTFHLADAAVLIFWLVAAIATLQSEYLYEAFWGNEGRYSGLFLITLYVIFYFVVSRFWVLKGWILEAFLISGMIMCYIGITDYFQMDILHFRMRIKPEQSTIFTSTVGNINTYTAYVALLMGLAAAMFATAKTFFKSLWYYICLIVTFFAIIMGCSDNAYLAIGALFAFLPFALFRSRKGVCRYLVILASFFTVIQCIDYINQAFADRVIGLDSLFQVLVNFGGLMPVVVILWVIALTLWIFWCRYPGKAAKNTGDMGLDRNHGSLSANKGGDELGKRLLYAWLCIIAIGVLAVCFALFDANVLGNGERYGSLGNYLVFNDQWGTNRGYIWRKSMEIYQDFPVMHKIFGFGPDTFGILTTENFKMEMVDATGQIFDSAHNEYLQFLVTVGPIGLIAYLAFLAGGAVRLLKNRMRNPYIVGCLFAVICYDFQALVNLNLPIATPMMWLLMSAGTAASRHKADA